MRQRFLEASTKPKTKIWLRGSWAKVSALTTSRGLRKLPSSSSSQTWRKCFTTLRLPRRSPPTRESSPEIKLEESVLRAYLHTRTVMESGSPKEDLAQNWVEFLVQRSCLSSPMTVLYLEPLWRLHISNHIEEVPTLVWEVVFEHG